MIMAKIRNPKPRKPVRRSEINGITPAQIWHRETAREKELWLLRSGLSPEAGRPMSEIGIYTDFT